MAKTNNSFNLSRDSGIAGRTLQEIEELEFKTGEDTAAPSQDEQCHYALSQQAS